MFLLNTLAVNGLMNWRNVGKFIEARNSVVNAEKVKVNLFGNDKEIFYWHKVREADTPLNGNNYEYCGTIQLPGIIPSELVLQPSGKNPEENGGLANLSWGGSEGLFGNGINKSVKLNKNNKIQTITIRDLGVQDGRVRIQNDDQKTVFIDGIEADPVEAFSVDEALFLIDQYIKILEQIKVPKAVAV